MILLSCQKMKFSEIYVEDEIVRLTEEYEFAVRCLVKLYGLVR